MYVRVCVCAAPVRPSGVGHATCVLLVQRTSRTNGMEQCTQRRETPSGVRWHMWHEENPGPCSFSATLNQTQDDGEVFPTNRGNVDRDPLEAGFSPLPKPRTLLEDCPFSARRSGTLG